MPRWNKQNPVRIKKPENPLKRGAARDDGLVFWSYYKARGKVYERWVSSEKFIFLSTRSRDNARKNYPKKSEKERARNRDYHRRNKEKIAQRKRIYKDLARDRIAKYARERRLSNLARDAESSSRRRQVIRDRTINACRATILCFYEIRDRVSKCTGILHHVDHIYPLARGGLHHQCNLQVLPAKINQRKSKKLPHEAKI